MLVRVSPIDRAQQLAKDWANLVVSMVGPSVDQLPKFDSAVMHMSIVMEDTEIVTDPWAPQFEDIAAIFDIANGKSNVLVHCEGGISRSTAVGIGLLVADGMPVDDAVKAIHQWSPNIGPNRLILSHIDRYLGMGGKFVQQVNDAVAHLPKGLMLWCNDCQIHFMDEDGHDCPGNHWQGPTK